MREQRCKISLFLLSLEVRTLSSQLALLLAQFRMQAAQEEFKSAYRMQVPRLADLAFAEIKEKLHRNEIPWKKLAKSRENKAIVHDDVVNVSFEPLNERKFLRIGTLHSVEKRDQFEE